MSRCLSVCCNVKPLILFKHSLASEKARISAVSPKRNRFVSIVWLWKKNESDSRVCARPAFSRACQLSTFLFTEVQPSSEVKSRTQGSRPRTQKNPRPRQCRRQSKRSEGALAESGGGGLNKLNFCTWKLNRSCTAINIRNFCNSVFMSKKRRPIRPAAFLSLFRLWPTTAWKIYLQQRMLPDTQPGFC